MTFSSRINELFWARWQTKVFESAIQLGVFTELAKQPLTAGELRTHLELRCEPRAATDFFDSLVVLGLLRREGNHYANTDGAAEHLDANKPVDYIGEALGQVLRMQDIDLTTALLKGLPSEVYGSGTEFYSRLYSTNDSAHLFLRGMTALSLGAAEALAEKFPWDQHHVLVDVGCAEGALISRVLTRHPHLTAVGFDLPETRKNFEDHTSAAGVSDRMRFQDGNFFHDPLPTGDVIVLGQVLHNWNLDQKLEILRKAYEALPAGGAVVIDEALIDESGQGNVIALFTSVLMNLGLGGAFDFTGTECQEWLRQCGFTATSVEHLAGTRSMVVGIK